MQKERLVEIIYSCRSATNSVDSVVTTIEKETGSCVNDTAKDLIRRYKEKGAGLEKCVDEVYDLLNSNSSCPNPCAQISCGKHDPYSQTRFGALEDPNQTAIIIKHLTKQLGQFFDINQLEMEHGFGCNVYIYNGSYYKISTIDKVIEDAIDNRVDQLLNSAYDVAKDEVNDVMSDCQDPFFELGLILGCEEITAVEDVVIVETR